MHLIWQSSEAQPGRSNRKREESTKERGITIPIPNPKHGKPANLYTFCVADAHFNIKVRGYGLLLLSTQKPAGHAVASCWILSQCAARGPGPCTSRSDTNTHAYTHTVETVKSIVTVEDWS